MRGTVVVSRRPNQTDKPRTALKEEKKKEKKKRASVNSCYEFPSSKHNHDTHTQNAKVKDFKSTAVE